MGIDKFVSAIYTADRTKAKPDPEAAFRFSRQFDLDRDNIVMVGDSKVHWVNKIALQLLKICNGIQI